MPSYIKSVYEYTKLRRNFGRQPLFQDVSAQMIDSINPNIAYQKDYILRNPVNREVQATLPQSQNEINTKTLVIREQGINHTEGGWPREVHLYNEEHLIRHRRRVMHEDNYIHAIKKLAPMMEHYVDQNNAINIYETYFDDMQSQVAVEKYNVRVANVFRDSYKRPISCLSWTNEKIPKLAVSYSDKTCTLNSEIYRNNDCYLWDICKQTEPFSKLQPDGPCWQLACSPIHPELLIGGLANGVVNVFDIRESANAISRSTIYNSHRGPITALLFTHSRTNTEFFTGSPDGQCLWWDFRNLSKPLDHLPMSVKIPVGQEPNLSNAEGVSSLEFDHALPTKFLCGTESGLVINVNRMGRSHSEILTSYWNTHSGPVRAVHRSPCTIRMFLTCGDWTVRVWSEEVRTAPIIVTKPYNNQVTDASWTPLRFSSYMAICEGGNFYYWDFLRKYREPVATLKVSKYQLTRLTCHSEGKSVAIGDINGSVFLVQLSENMVIPGNHDKQLMSQTYERETRREHILDARLKEIRLKIRAEEETPTTMTMPDESSNEENLIQITEQQYFKIVKDELHQLVTKTTPSNESISQF
ncbi:dynein intermediate chain 3, ciliary-like [Galleria mellonella]|uniref:Dynein intermediate chain 3, ciliary-like n=1 Tax=Galleria mellonella TaxID=7137 RepID=A0A6J1WGX1_GALME|nr:dynein intermediate chain 3, ciliary-like [Galleria mellonella]